MANQSEKRRFEANRKRLQYILLAVVSSNVWYIFWRVIIQKASVFWFNYCTLFIANSVYLASYGILHAAARPVYSSSKELVSAGSDLSMSGFLEYVNDAIILMVILQFLGGITDWAWLLSLIAPGYGVYVAWTSFQQIKKAAQVEVPGEKDKKGRGQRRREQKPSRQMR